MDMLTETTVSSFNRVVDDIQNVTFMGVKVRFLVMLLHTDHAIETIQISPRSKFQVISTHSSVKIHMKE